MHPDVDELIHAAEGSATTEVQRHLTVCEACRGEAARLRLEPVLAEQLTWTLAGSVHAASVDHQTLARIQTHDDSMSGESEILEHLRRSHDALFSDPRVALGLADDVLRSLEQASDDHLRVLALRERANALHRLGRFDDALSTIDEASGLARHLPVGEYELAVLGYIRADVLRERGDLQGAIEGASAARVTLLAFGDDERALNAEVLRAVALFDSGDREAALEAHELILRERAAELSDVLYSTLHQNRAWCLVLLGRLEEAEASLETALNFYQSREMTVELTRVRWTLGHVAAKSGRGSEARDIFVRVADDLDRLGMSYEGATARLDLIAQLLADGLTTEVPRLAREIASVFSTAGSKPQLAEALALLRDSNVVEDTASAVRIVDELRQDLPMGHPLGNLAN